MECVKGVNDLVLASKGLVNQRTHFCPDPKSLVKSSTYVNKLRDDSPPTLVNNSLTFTIF